MWLPVLGLLTGILIGLLTGVEIPPAYHIYVLLLLLVMVDALFGALKETLRQNYSNIFFITGLFFSLLLAWILAFLGRQLDVELYLAPLIALGIRIFQNTAAIRREILSLLQSKK
ncbi:small basic family protein [Salibacterium halotolerans]|uniref:Small basic protein n=1 Tax=Salibacterium halotolerans TaxID=1884432 RepID=A0A1I5M560_9BACI|nr:small basic family protein [Salibacterium halotolerans]SFP04744.1 Small basic protein [Salibacterium halotolerans]